MYSSEVADVGLVSVQTQRPFVYVKATDKPAVVNNANGATLPRR